MPCTSVTGVPYQGAYIELEAASGKFACAAASLSGGNATGPMAIVWDNGDESFGTWKLNFVGTPLIEYNITNGALEGTRMLQELGLNGFNGNCALHPMTRAGFVGMATAVRQDG